MPRRLEPKTMESQVPRGLPFRPRSKFTIGHRQEQQRAVFSMHRNRQERMKVKAR